MFFGNVHDLDHFAHGHGFVHMEGNVHIGLLAKFLFQSLLEFVEGDATGLYLVTEVGRDGHRGLGFGRRLVFALWQDQLEGIGVHKGRREHEEDEQQEDDIRHGAHAKGRTYFTTSF